MLNEVFLKSTDARLVAPVILIFPLNKLHPFKDSDVSFEQFVKSNVDASVVNDVQFVKSSPVTFGIYLSTLSPIEDSNVDTVEEYEVNVAVPLIPIRSVLYNDEADCIP